MSFTPATRSRVKLKLGIFGPSGSGKTYSSLLLAHGLVGDWSKIGLIDTENGSGDLYSHLGEYLVSPLLPPYSPLAYRKKIHEAEQVEGLECLIIDSISHEWDGPGGCLDIHAKFGGKFQDWAKVTPMHQEFIQAILRTPLHVIVTGRTKTDYSMDRDSNNRTRIEKVGLKISQREGLDYELTTAFRLAHNNYATIEKDRTGFFHDIPPFIISKETGEKIREWNLSGAEIVLSEREKTLKMIKEAIISSGENPIAFLENMGLPTLEEIKELDQDSLNRILTTLMEDL